MGYSGYFWAGPVAMPVPPPARVLHISPGAYAVVPSSGVPSWAIALVMGVLALAGVAGLLVRARQLRRAGP